MINKFSDLTFSASNRSTKDEGNYFWTCSSNLFVALKLNEYLQTEDNAEGLRNDPHGLLPTLDELAAARPPGRHRTRPEFRVRINFASCRSLWPNSSSLVSHFTGKSDYSTVQNSSHGTVYPTVRGVPPWTVVEPASLQYNPLLTTNFDCPI